jgi:hypothetical protein
MASDATVAVCLKGRLLAEDMVLIHTSKFSISMVSSNNKPVWAMDSMRERKKPESLALKAAVPLPFATRGYSVMSFCSQLVTA